VGCLDNQLLPQFDNSQLALLLTADSCKSWHLVNRYIDGQETVADCERDDFWKICISTEVTNPDTMSLFGGTVLCPGQNDSLLMEGTWFLSDTASNDAIFLIVNEDTTRLNIESISSQFLNLTFVSSNHIFLEEFSAN